jgi:hypothetical protein
MNADLERDLRDRLRRADLPDAPDSLYASLEAVVRTRPQRAPDRDRRRTTLRLLAVAAVLVVGGAAVIAGGGWLDGQPVVQSPLPSPALPTDPTSQSASPSVEPTNAPTSVAATPSPSATPTGGAGAPPVRATASLIAERVVLAPGRDGILIVAIPAPDGAVLLLLDRDGRARPGWPIVVPETTACPLVLPVDDGSIRAVCSTREVIRPREADQARAFAFDATGRSLPGWPVELGPTNQLDEPALYAGRMLGDELRLSVSTNTVYQFARLTVVTASGEVQRGADLALNGCCEEWGVGPDGVAYGVARPSDLGFSSSEPSRLTSVDHGGRRSGWPVEITGIASGPAFASDGRIILVFDNRGQSSRVVTIRPAGAGTAETSDNVPVTTSVVEERCPPVLPRAPIVIGDGTTFVFSGRGGRFAALDASMDALAGWPFTSTQPLGPVGFDDPLASEFCPSFANPAAGEDGTLYLPLRTRDATVGGSLVAVGRDGQIRDGWPVELTRPGAAFWAVVVGADGTVHALAVEPEAGGTSSATILAIEPDSTIRFTATIIEPEAP